YACAGEQDCAMGKCLTPEKERGQVIERPFDLSHRRLAGEYGLVLALNFDSDLPIPSPGFTCANLDPGAQGTGMLIDFCLRQIKQVLPFDISRAHIIADGVSNDFPARV